MTILALDTTSEFGSIALRRDGRPLLETSLHAPGGFGHVLFEALEKCKNELPTDFCNIDCFAVAVGPGSFTGVRVGLSAAKGLAESTGKRVCGVSNLRALSSFGKTQVLRAVALDARRADIYAAVYDSNLTIVSSEVVCPFETWLAQLDPSSSYEFVFPSGQGLASRLAGSPFEHCPVVAAPRALAAAVALCAEQDGVAGRWQDPAALDANYVRRSDAELSWKDLKS